MRPIPAGIRNAAVLPLVLGAMWLVLVAWRPFTFGFYHDDWSSVALPLDRSGGLWKILTGDPARPLYIVILYMFRLAFGAHAWAWQAALAAIHLACAWGIGRTANALFDRQAPGEARSPWPGMLAGAAWLAFPWSLGYSAWAIMLSPLVGIGMAAWALALMAGARDRRTLVLSGVLLCSSWTIYEASWFFWLPPALLLAARARHPLDGDRARWKWVGWMAALQVGFIALNRFLAAGSPVAKRVSPEILNTLASDRHLLGAQLLPQLEKVWLPLAIGFGLLALCAIAQSARSGGVIRLLANIAMSLWGVAITVLLYAAAGYAIEWEGLFSRVTMAISFWLALLVGALVAAAEGGSWRPLAWPARAAGLVLCAALGAALLQQGEPWRRSWQEQQQIVNAMPEELVRLSDPRTLMLMDLPRGPAPVYGFSAFWDISGALSARMPLEQTVSSATHAFASVLRPGEWRTRWDGQFVSQAWCNAPDSPMWRLPAERVFLWRYPGQEIVPIPPGFTTGCQKEAPG